MAHKLSRRNLASYVAAQLISGTSNKKVAMQLAAYLVSTKRTKELNLIVRDVEVYLAEKGYVAGKVTSAFELSATTIKLIEDFTKQKTGAKSVSLEKSVDKFVLGGIKLEIPGYELDTTVARQLTILKTRHKKA
jgi:F0F1-type ATP synthase delta subunit